MPTPPEEFLDAETKKPMINPVAIDKKKVTESSKIEYFLKFSEIIKNFTIPKQDIKKGILIGSGSSGTVFKSIYNNMTVAIKEISKYYDVNIQNEAIILAAFKSKYIVAFIGIYENSDNNYSLVMEYASEGSLAKLIYQDKSYLDWNYRYLIIIDIAKGIRYIESNGVDNNDINSSNILLFKEADGSYHAKLCDFGLAIIRKKDSVNNYQYWNCNNYGTILWEISTYKVPSARKNLEQVKKDIPTETPSKVKELIINFWNIDPNHSKHSNIEYAIHELESNLEISKHKI